MNIVLAILCAGSVAFMLWFLVALVKDSKTSARPSEVYLVKCEPSGRRGNVVVMNPKARDHKLAVGDK
jgi:hypothetical protein